MLRLHPREQVEFFETLAHLLRAGMRVEQSLEVIGEAQADGPVGELCRGALIDLRRGLPLSDALQQLPGINASVIGGIVRAGERAGNLAGAVAEVARSARYDLEMRGALANALMYPALVVCAMAVTVVILIGYVIPQFSAIFEQAQLTPTWGTRVVLSIGRLIQTHGWLLAALAAVGALLLALLLKSRPAWALRLWFVTPFFGQLAAERDAGRICAALGTLLQGGVPLLDSLGVAHAVAASPNHAQRLLDAATEARSGNRLAPVFKDILPGTAWGLVMAGEESGQLAAMILEAGHLCDQQVRRRTERGIALVEPLLILVISLMVAVVVGTLLLPLMQLSTGGVM